MFQKKGNFFFLHGMHTRQPAHIWLCWCAWPNSKTTGHQSTARQQSEHYSIKRFFSLLEFCFIVFNFSVYLLERMQIPEQFLQSVQYCDQQNLPQSNNSPRTKKRNATVYLYVIQEFQRGIFFFALRFQSFYRSVNVWSGLDIKICVMTSVSVDFAARFWNWIGLVSPRSCKPVTEVVFSTTFQLEKL